MNKKQDVAPSVEIEKKIQEQVVKLPVQEESKTMAITDGENDSTELAVVESDKADKEDRLAQAKETLAEIPSVAQVVQQAPGEITATQAGTKVSEQDMIEEAQVFEKIDKEAAQKESAIDYQLETLWTSGRKEMLNQERALNKESLKSREAVKKETEKEKLEQSDQIKK